MARPARCTRQLKFNLAAVLSLVPLRRMGPEMQAFADGGGDLDMLQMSEAPRSGHIDALPVEPARVGRRHSAASGVGFPARSASAAMPSACRSALS
jgi:hypothetical protein